MVSEIESSSFIQMSLLPSSLDQGFFLSLTVSHASLFSHVNLEPSLITKLENLSSLKSRSQKKMNEFNEGEHLCDEKKLKDKQQSGKIFSIRVAKNTSPLYKELLENSNNNLRRPINFSDPPKKNPTKHKK